MYAAVDVQHAWERRGGGHDGRGGGGGGENEMGPIQHEYRERYGDEEMGISCYQDQSIRSIEQFARFAIMGNVCF